ncbi:MAG: LytR/AlgR family response regulator transcription factor [Candidatus Oxydemutatoraceae bacterium WSBS_2016_MAG_OTU14]
MNILIVDDEPMAVSRLTKLVESIPGCRLVGSASNGLEAIQKVQSINVDLVLMDIHLPGINGIKAAQQLRALPNPPAIVITTAYPEFTLAAFAIPASGYLLKPITAEKLSDVIYKAQSLMQQSMQESLPFTDIPSQICICCHQRGKYDLLPIQKIYYMESVDKYTHIFHKDGLSLTRQTLRHLLGQYPEQFLQIHRKIIINRTYLRSLQRIPHSRHFLVALHGVHKMLNVSRRNLPFLRAYLDKIFTNPILTKKNKS